VLRLNIHRKYTALPGLWFNGFRPELQDYFHSAAKGPDRIAQGILSAHASGIERPAWPETGLAA